jgi:hypothetical protein
MWVHEMLQCGKRTWYIVDIGCCDVEYERSKCYRWKYEMLRSVGIRDSTGARYKWVIGDADAREMGDAIVWEQEIQ